MDKGLLLVFENVSLSSMRWVDGAATGLQSRHCRRFEKSLSSHYRTSSVYLGGLGGTPKEGGFGGSPPS